MNEEYLWDKTGSDAEIEGLENALMAFRYKPVEPPALPAKAFSLAENPRRNWFKLGFAVAFAAAVIAVVPAVWFLVPNRSVVTETVKTVDPVPVVVKNNDDGAKVEALPAEAPPINIDGAVFRPAAKRLKPLAANSFVKDHPVKLTKEEKYAYGQLMLALSITESKLKIVRDAIAGNEEIKPSLQKEKDLYQK